MKKFSTVLALLALITVAVMASPSPALGASPQAAVIPDTSCVHMSIEKARHAFHLPSGQPSQASDWFETSSTLLRYADDEHGHEVEGIVPNHARATVDESYTYTSLRGAHIRAGFMLVGCIPASHLPEESRENFYPDGVWDAQNHWHGTIKRWREVEDTGGSSYIGLKYQWRNDRPKLPSFTTPDQCTASFTQFKRIQNQLVRYTYHTQPREVVPPVKGLTIYCYVEQPWY